MSSPRNIVLGAISLSPTHRTTRKGYNVPRHLEEESSIYLPRHVVFPFCPRVMRGLAPAHLSLSTSVSISPCLCDTRLFAEFSVCPVFVHTAPSYGRGTLVTTSVGASLLPTVFENPNPYWRRRSPSLTKFVFFSKSRKSVTKRVFQTRVKIDKEPKLGEITAPTLNSAYKV